MIEDSQLYKQEKIAALLPLIEHSLFKLESFPPQAEERNRLAHDILKMVLPVATFSKPVKFSGHTTRRKEKILQLSLGSTLDIGINSEKGTVTIQAGGKAINHFRACHNSLGIPSQLIGLSAQGSNGEIFDDLLQTRLTSPDNLHLFKLAKNIRINIHFDDKLYSTPGPQIKPEEAALILKEFENRAIRADWLVLAGSLYPGIPEDTFIDIISKYGKTKKIILDSRELWEKDIFGEAAPFMIKPNLSEFIRLGFRYYPKELAPLTPAISPLNILPLAEKFVTEKKIPIVIVTKDNKPFIALTKNSKFLVTPPQIEKNSDIGSGDALLVGLLDIFTREKLTEEIPEKLFKQALRHATAFAAASAECPGSSFAQDMKRIAALENKVKIEKI